MPRLNLRGRSIQVGILLSFCLFFSIGLFAAYTFINRQFSPDNLPKDDRPISRRLFATGQVYYVDPNGSDTNAGTVSAPFKTITKGASVLTPGSTLRVRPGTYQEMLSGKIPGGTSWDNPVIIMADDPGNRPIIKTPPSDPGCYNTSPPPFPTGVTCYQITLQFGGTGTYAPASQSFIKMTGFVIDGSTASIDAVKITNGAHDIWLDNMEVKNGWYQGILITNEASINNRLTNLHVHHNGTKTPIYRADGTIHNSELLHNIYISTSNNLLENSEIDNAAGHGIHNYGGTPSNNTYRNNYVHHNKRGIGVYIGSNNQVHNNLVYANGSYGVYVDYGAQNTKAHHNTVVESSSFGMAFFSGNTQAYNNIVTKSGLYGISVGSAGTTDLKNNLLFNNGSNGASSIGTYPNGHAVAPTQSGNITGKDPQFTAYGSDFTLKSGSPAIDAGIAVNEVTADKTGKARPLGSAYDVGAYEWGEAPTPTPLPGSSTSTLSTPQSASGSSVAVSQASASNSGSSAPSYVSSPIPYATASPKPKTTSKPTPKSTAKPESSASTPTPVREVTPEPLKIHSSGLADIRTSQARLTVNANHGVKVTLEYGPDTNYGKKVEGKDMLALQSLTMTGLQAGTIYHFKVSLVDALGQTVVSEDQTFTTAEVSLADDEVQLPPPMVKKVEVGGRIIVPLEKLTLVSGRALIKLSGMVKDLPPGSTVVSELHSRGAAVNEASISPDGSWSLKINVIKLKPGAHSVKVFSKDSHGNVSPSVEVLNFTVEQSFLGEKLPTPLLILLNDLEALSLWLWSLLALLAICIVLLAQKAWYLRQKSKEEITLWRG